MRRGLIKVASLADRPEADCPENFISLAHRLADASGEILRRYFRQPLAADSKSDLSPVTIADREAESAIRKILADGATDHGIFGEEFGNERIDADYVWVIDPIDGTKSFITGKPLFGTLIACLRNGKPILGIVDQPILRERWLGAAGRQTTFNGRAVKVRACSELSAAMLYATTPHMFSGDDAAAFGRLCGRVRYPNYGADCYAYGLLANGHVDLVVEASLKPYDFCALVPVVEGAGGRMTDWQGAALGLASDGRVIAAGDPRARDAALAVLAPNDSTAPR